MPKPTKPAMHCPRHSRCPSSSQLDLGSELLKPTNPADGLIPPEAWAAVGESLMLTMHELAIAANIFHGTKRAAFARKVGRHPGSIRYRIDGLFKKLNVKDRRGLVLRLVRVYLTLLADGTLLKWQPAPKCGLLDHLKQPKLT